MRFFNGRMGEHRPQAGALQGHARGGRRHGQPLDAGQGAALHGPARLTARWRRKREKLPAMETATRRRKHWGWGYEDQQPPPEQVREAAAGIRSHLGFEPLDAEEPVPLSAVELPAPRLEPPAVARRAVLHRSARARLARLRPLLPRRGARLPRPLRPSAGRGGPPRGRGRPAAAARVVRRRPRGRDPLRRRHERGGRRRARGGRRLRGRGVDRPLAARPRARGRRRVARRAHPGRRERPARSRTSSASTGSRCGTSRSRSSSPRSAAGSPRARAATSPRSTRTSTTSWSRCARSRRRACGSRGGCPAPAPGPSPDRLLIGSEGILGVITEAWVRVQARPDVQGVRARCTSTASAREREAVRALSQAGLYPSNCRLLDPGEAAITGSATDGKALLVLGFESADHPVDAWMERAVELLRGPRREVSRSAVSEVGRGRRAPGARPSFRRPTCATRWSLPACSARRSRPPSPGTAWTASSAGVQERAASALYEAYGGGTVSCRFTHVYPDGAAPYFTLLAPARRGSELEQWAEVKDAASEAVLAAGRHDHAPPRGGPRPPALVRPAAPRAVRRTPCARPRRRSTLRASSTPACSWTRRERTTAQAQPAARGPDRARAVAAAPADRRLAWGAARERVRDRVRQRRRARGHRARRAGRSRPARAGARPGGAGARARAPARLHARPLGPLRPGRADHGSVGLRAVDAPASRAHDARRREPGARARAPDRGGAPERRAGAGAPAVPGRAQGPGHRHREDRDAATATSCRGWWWTPTSAPGRCTRRPVTRRRTSSFTSRIAAC